MRALGRTVDFIPGGKGNCHGHREAAHVGCKAVRDTILPLAKGLKAGIHPKTLNALWVAPPRHTAMDGSEAENRKTSGSPGSEVNLAPEPATSCQHLTLRLSNYVQILLRTGNYTTQNPKLSNRTTI